MKNENMSNSEKNNTSWFAIRTLENSFHFGIGVGWDTSDNTTCLVLQFAFWVIAIGPNNG